MSDKGGNTSVQSILANPNSLLVADPQQTYGEKRPCAFPGCITRLNRYNPNEYCDLHRDAAYDPRTLAMDYDSEGRRRCATCGRMLAPNLRCFYSDLKSKDGLSAECIACLNPARAEKEHQTSLRAGRAYTVRNRERINARKREARR